MFVKQRLALPGSANKLQAEGREITANKAKKKVFQLRQMVYQCISELVQLEMISNTAGMSKYLQKGSNKYLKLKKKNKNCSNKYVNMFERLKPPKHIFDYI